MFQNMYVTKNVFIATLRKCVVRNLIIGCGELMIGNQR